MNLMHKKPFNGTPNSVAVWFPQHCALRPPVNGSVEVNRKEYCESCAVFASAFNTCIWHD